MDNYYKYKATKYKYKYRLSKNLIQKGGSILKPGDIDKLKLTEHSCKNKILDGYFVKKIKQMVHPILSANLKKEILGTGTSGNIVYDLHDKYALKMLPLQNSIKVAKYYREVHIHKMLNKYADECSHFPKFYGNYEDEINGIRYGFIILKKYTNVEDYFGSNFKKIEMSKLKSFLIQALMGVYFLYKIYKDTGSIITHIDIKLDNLLVEDTNRSVNVYEIGSKKIYVPTYGFNVILSDFGRGLVYDNKCEKNDPYFGSLSSKGRHFIKLSRDYKKHKFLEVLEYGDDSHSDIKAELLHNFYKDLFGVVAQFDKLLKHIKRWNLAKLENIAKKLFFYGERQVPITEKKFSDRINLVFQ